TVDGFNRDKEYGPDDAPSGIYKCQVFGYEILLRSGFRVRMISWREGDQTITLYYRVNRVVADARKLTGVTIYQPGVIGYSGENLWGRRWDLVLRSLPDHMQAAEINRLIEEEGRAFYLVNEFPGPDKKRSGHFQLVERAGGPVPPNWPGPEPIAWEEQGDPTQGTTSGLLWIQATVLEAPGVGLRRSTGMVVPFWDEWFRVADASQYIGLGSNNNDLLLIEALPGPDPHTQDGVRALCAIHRTNY
ncbi:MAG TPA: hypothetical protein VML54_12080, partial [Candidatus Limnocylindrales bacterium]|nr:hypothetical protein [Candidatus Limnocylindrales bacterium]